MQDAEVELNSIPKGEEGKLLLRRRCHHGAPQEAGKTLIRVWAISSPGNGLPACSNGTAAR